MVGWPETSDGAEATRQRVHPPEPRPGEYRSLHDYATVARVALGLVALSSIVGAVFDTVERDLLGGPASTGELQASEDRLTVLGIASALILVVTVIFFVAWVHRAYANLRALGVETLRFGTGWAVGAWFVPILGFFRPLQIVNDIWRGSHPYLADRYGWRDTKVPRLIGVWWAAWLISWAVGSVAALLLDDVTPGSGAVESSYSLAIAGDLLIAVAALLALAVVDRTTARQEAAAARAVGSGGRAVPARRWLLGARRLAAVAALCAAAAGLGALVVAVQPPAAAPSPEAAPEPPAGEAPGAYSLSDDFSNPASGWVVESREQASYAYEEGEYRISVTSPEMTWFSLLGLPTALDPLELDVDVRLASPPPAEAAVGLGCFITDRYGYFATISPDGYWALALDPVDTEQLSLLEDGNDAATVGNLTAPTRLALRCEGGPPAILTLSVGGRVVGQARHDAGPGTFGIAALVASSGSDDTTAYFDDLALRSPSSSGP